MAGPRQVERAVQLRQLALAGDKDGSFNLRRLTFKKRKSGGEIGRGNRGWHGGFQLAVPDLLVQPDRFLAGLDTQLFGQEAATGLVLGQGGGPLAAPCKRAHQVLVGCLIPGLQFDLPPGEGLGLLVLAALLVGCCQVMERGGHLAGEPLAGKERPFLKGGAVAEGEPLQETAPV